MKYHSLGLQGAKWNVPLQLGSKTETSLVYNSAEKEGRKGWSFKFALCGYSKHINQTQQGQTLLWYHQDMSLTNHTPKLTGLNIQTKPHNTILKKLIFTFPSSQPLDHRMQYSIINYNSHSFISHSLHAFPQTLTTLLYSHITGTREKKRWHTSTSPQRMLIDSNLLHKASPIKR